MLIYPYFQCSPVPSPQTFSYALTSKDVKTAISRGKIASLLGVEGYVAFLLPHSPSILTPTPAATSSATRSKSCGSTKSSACAT